MIRVGFLIPYSGIHKTIAADLSNGFKMAVHDLFSPGSVSYFGEFIKSGRPEDITSALTKLYQYDQVDLVVGVVGSKVFPQVIELTTRFGKPFFAINLGGDIPKKEIISPYLFYNSMHAWQSTFALAQWAQQKWGGMPGTALSTYEAGYDLHYAFQCGATAGGATQLRKVMIPYTPGSYDTTSVIQDWQQQDISYAYGLVSGKEGLQLIDQFIQSGLAEKFPLLVNYHLVENDMPIPAGYESLPVPLYTATGWDKTDPSQENLLFLEKNREQTTNPPGVYTLLAYEVGLVLKATMRLTQQRNITRATIDAIEQMQVNGPRGKLSIATKNLDASNTVFILKAEVSDNTWTHTIIDKVDGINTANSFIDQNELVLAGWQNPYLCV